MPDKTKREPEPVKPKEAFDRLDRLFRGVVSASNKAVQERMKTQKAARARKKKRR